MSWINYDDNGKPEATLEMVDLARMQNKFLIHIICEQDDVDPEFLGVTFMALVDVIPRIGEHITIEDGSVCEVFWISHEQYVRKNEDDSIHSIGLIPNVVARLICKAPR